MTLEALEGLEVELAYAVQTGKPAARIAAIRAAIKAVRGDVVETTVADVSAVETTSPPKRSVRR